MVDADVWHVVMRPAAYRGDAELSGGQRPFDALPDGGKTTGASVVITLAGLSADAARTGEFLERFVELGRDVDRAPGNRATLVQAAADGAVLTFSAWATLRDAVTWAYHRPEHAATVRRQHEHGLATTSGFLRCAVVHSSGTLGSTPDPLAGHRGTVGGVSSNGAGSCGRHRASVRSRGRRGRVGRGAARRGGRGR